MDRFQKRKENQGILVGGAHMKWVVLIIAVIIFLVFLFMAAALVAVMFANVDYDEMEVGKTNKRTESISKTTNRRK